MSDDMKVVERYDTFFSKAYRTHQRTPVLVIGPTTFTLEEFTELLQSNHTRAARQLTKLFKRLHISEPAHILSVAMVDWARIDRVGESCLRLLLDLLYYANVPQKQIDKWVQDEGNVQWRTFVSRARKQGKKRGKHVV